MLAPTQQGRAHSRSARHDPRPASSLWKRLRRTRPLTHAVLIFGCLLFGFPFFWLVTTSMKEQREVFSDPPQWIPRMPPAGLVSPYIAQDEYREPAPPPGVADRLWEHQWPQLQTELWTAGSVRLRNRVSSVQSQVGNRESRIPLTRGLWERLAASVPPDRLQAVIKSPRKVRALVTRDLCDVVWDRIYKPLELRTPTVRDRSYQTYLLRTGEHPAWESRDAKVATLTWVPQAAEPTSRVHYDFHHGDTARLRSTGRLPMAPERFLRVTIPLRPDRSYHRVEVTVDAGGRVYRSKRPLLLDTDLWQEASWQVETVEEEGTLFRDYIPLVAAGRSKRSPTEIKIALAVTRNTRLRAAGDKAIRNFRAALQFLPLTRYLWNTLLLVFLTVFGELTACSLVAYSFARLKWPGRDLLFGLLLATMMLPGQVTMIPVFLIFKSLGWYNTLKPLWVGSFFGSAFFIFMLRQFMRSIPRELEEAARIDGCGYFGCYWRIILPLMKPALAAVAIFTFMNTWNNFMGPLIYLNDQRLYPLSLGLFQFRLEHSTDFGMLMSASTIMTLPVVAVFFLAQKHFIQGVTLTGIKG